MFLISLAKHGSIIVLKLKKKKKEILKINQIYMKISNCYVKPRLGDCTGEGGGGSGEKYVDDLELGEGGHEDSGNILTSLW